MFDVAVAGKRIELIVREELKIGVECKFVVEIEVKFVVRIATHAAIQIVFVEGDVTNVGGRVLRGRLALVLLLRGGEMLLERPA